MGQYLSFLVRKSKSSKQEDTKTQYYFILGGPGAGKGTQCKQLTDNPDFDAGHFSSGEELRKFVKLDCQESQEIKRIMEDGGIVPSQRVVSLLKHAIEQCQNKIVLLDGFPRSMNCRNEFEKQMKRDCTKLIVLTCSEEERLNRLKQRLLTQGRADDKDKVIKKRFKVYEDTTRAVINYYKEHNKVINVNANGSIHEVQQRFQRAILE